MIGTSSSLNYHHGSMLYFSCASLESLVPSSSTDRHCIEEVVNNYEQRWTTREVSDCKHCRRADRELSQKGDHIKTRRPCYTFTTMVIIVPLVKQASNGMVRALGLVNKHYASNKKITMSQGWFDGAKQRSHLLFAWLLSTSNAIFVLSLLQLL